MNYSAVYPLLLVMFLSLAACQQTPTDDADPISASEAQAPPPDDLHVHPPVQGSIGIMKAKLAHAQAVLEGIVLEDFDQVEKNAQHLNSLSQQAEWLVHRTVEYTVFSSEFRRVTEDLAKNAAKKNIHAVTLDYMQMTMTCVKCHSHMRWQGLAQADAPAPLTAMTSHNSSGVEERGHFLSKPAP